MAVAARKNFPESELGGRAVVAEARPLSFEWRTGDEGTRARQSHYFTESPGSREAPAVRHLYETTSLDTRPEGVYTISLAVAWQGRYRVTNLPGHPCTRWCSLGTLRTVSERPYRVGYVESVLIG